MTIRIAHLTDIHFGGEIPEAVEAAIGVVADFDPTVTLITGDLTLNGLPEEFRAAAAWLQRLPRARLTTPGNHDTPYWNLLLRSLVPFERYQKYIGRSDAGAMNASGLIVRTLNSARGFQARPDWSKGVISLGALKQIDWGDPAMPFLRVFGCHHPLVDIEGAPVTGEVHRGPAAVSMLADAGVELLLSGHVHVPFSIELTRGNHFFYAVGAGTLSQRTRLGTLPSFSTITVEDAAFDITVMGWSGAAFEPVQSWTLPRRFTSPMESKALPMSRRTIAPNAAPPLT